MFCCLLCSFAMFLIQRFLDQRRGRDFFKYIIRWTHYRSYLMFRHNEVLCKILKLPGNDLCLLYMFLLMQNRKPTNFSVQSRVIRYNESRIHHVQSSIKSSYESLRLINKLLRRDIWIFFNLRIKTFVLLSFTCLLIISRCGK